MYELHIFCTKVCLSLTSFSTDFWDVKGKPLCCMSQILKMKWRHLLRLPKFRGNLATSSSMRWHAFAILSISFATLNKYVGQFQLLTLFSAKSSRLYLHLTGLFACQLFDFWDILAGIRNDSPNCEPRGGERRCQTKTDTKMPLYACDLLNQPVCWNILQVFLPKELFPDNFD